MTAPLCDRYSSEKSESKLDVISIEFNNIDGVPFWKESLFMNVINIADELFVGCEKPSEIVQQHSCEEIYREDIIITIQDHYKLKVQQLNWL